MSDTSATIRIACPHCKVVLETDASVEGTRVACPECGREFVAQRDKSPVVQAGKSNSKKKLVVGIAVLAVALLFMRTSCSGGHSKPGDNRDAVKAQFVRTSDKQFSTFGGDIKKEVLWVDDTIVINLWHDAVTLSAGLAASRVEPFVGLWNALKIKMLAANDEALEIAFSQGLEIHVMCNLLDSISPGTPLLTILDGNIIYDATLM